MQLTTIKDERDSEDSTHDKASNPVCTLYYAGKCSRLERGHISAPVSMGSSTAQRATRQIDGEAKQLTKSQRDGTSFRTLHIASIVVVIGVVGVGSTIRRL